MNKFSILFILFIALNFCHNNVSGQDARFSQYYAAPLYLNPALSGSYNGSYKLTAIYRDQWRGTFNEPITTAGFSGDARFNLGKKRRTGDAVSGGIMFLSDRTSLYDFNTTFIGLTSAYHKIIDAKNRTYLSGGFRFSMINKGVNYENLTFLDMFDGVDQFVFNTAEKLPINTLTFADLSVGLNFSTQPTSRSLFNLGIAVNHIFNNNISFYREEEIDPGEKEFIRIARINKLYHVDAQYTFPTSRLLQFSPRLAWRLQGNFMELSAGSSARLRFKKDARFAMHFGLWGRVNNYLDSYYFNSVVSMVGFELKNVLFGFSYDISIPDYAQYGFGRDAFELSISFTGDYSNNTLMCPEI